MHRWEQCEANGLKILRLVRPELDSDNSTVAVTYEIMVIQGDQVKDWFVDSHVRRFFFKNELILKSNINRPPDLRREAMSLSRRSRASFSTMYDTPSNNGQNTSTEPSETAASSLSCKNSMIAIPLSFLVRPLACGGYSRCHTA